jgi:hypothetical protein
MRSSSLRRREAAPFNKPWMSTAQQLFNLNPRSPQRRGDITSNVRQKMNPIRHIIAKFSLLLLACNISSDITCAEESEDPFAADAKVAMPMTPDHLVPLQPYPADWEIDYTKQLTKHLGLDEVYLARMIVRPSFGAEYLVRIRGDKKSYAFDHSERFFITVVASDESIWYSMPDNNSEKQQKPIHPKTFEATIPVYTARRVCGIWDEMILRTRYSREGGGGLDGVTIEFASRYGHGEAWTPRDGTAPALLWSLGESLITYAKAPEDERKAFLAAINKSADTVVAHLKRQSEQAGTGQPATHPESKPEGSDKPQPESEGRSR